MRGGWSWWDGRGGDRVFVFERVWRDCVSETGTMTVHAKRGVAGSVMIIHVEQSRENLAKEVLQISIFNHNSRVEGD